MTLLGATLFGTHMAGSGLVASSNFLVPGATFIVEVVAFAIVLGFLAKWVLPPLERMMAKRQAEIKSGLEDAEEGHRLREQAEEERRQVLAEARRDARAMAEAVARTAEEEKANILAQAREEHDRVIARAEAEIQRELHRAASDLRQRVADLVVRASERIIHREIDADAHRSFIEEAIAAVEAAGDGAAGGPPGASGSGQGAAAPARASAPGAGHAVAGRDGALGVRARA